MGVCINEKNNVITMRINEQENNYSESSYLKIKNKKPTAESSNNFYSQKNKVKLPLSTLYSKDISKLFNISDIKINNNDFTNFNSVREVLELFDFKINKNNNLKNSNIFLN